MKKCLSIFLSIIIVISLAMPALATNSTTNEIEAIADSSPRESGEVVHYNTTTGETLIEDGELLTFDDITITIPKSSSGSPNARGLEMFIVRGGIKKCSNGRFTWYFNVDCPTSPFVKPHIKLTAQLKGSFSTASSTYSNVGTSVYHTYTTNSQYGIDYTWTVPARTGYYYISYTIDDYDNDDRTYGATTTLLSNRTGHPWNFRFSDSASGKNLPSPPANYRKGATSTRPSNLADTYYKTYTSKTGLSLNRNLFDVHHIRPLAYGGTNSYSNLIHLPKATHKAVTSWWAGY